MKKLVTPVHPPELNVVPPIDPVLVEFPSGLSSAFVVVPLSNIGVVPAPKANGIAFHNLPTIGERVFFRKKGLGLEVDPPVNRAILSDRGGRPAFTGRPILRCT